MSVCFVEQTKKLTGWENQSRHSDIKFDLFFLNYHLPDTLNAVMNIKPANSKMNKKPLINLLFKALTVKQYIELVFQSKINLILNNSYILIQILKNLAQKNNKNGFFCISR